MRATQLFRIGTVRPQAGRWVAATLLAGCLLLSVPFPAHPQTGVTQQRVNRNPLLRVQVLGVTNTQAVLSYTPPDSNPCTVKISQQPSLTPLVHDVDPALFPGSGQDTRAETIATSASRIFVAGKRLTQRASDGRNYSRALETYSQHYYQITCGTTAATGTFTTANIPLGMTYADVPQVDEANPGQWMIPTMLQDRTQAIVDPQTGALLRRVSLDAEAGNHAYGYAGAFLYTGGFVRVCSPARTGPGQSRQGYLCTFPNFNLMWGLEYFIVPSTGETQFLGVIPYPGSSVNGSDLSLYYVSGDKSYRTTYTGNFRSAASSTETLAMAPPVIYDAASTNQLLKNFDPTFDDRYYTCGRASAGPGQYALFQCNRSIQDSYGWIGVFYGGDGRPIDLKCTAGDNCPRIVAAMNVFSAPATRFCGLHNIQLVPNNPLISLNFQQLRDPSGAIGTSPMATRLSSAISASDTTITVDGEPVSTATANGGDPVHQDAAPGDLFAIDSETVRITAINALPSGQRVWTVTRGTPPVKHDAGALVSAGCKAGFHMTYWKYLNDPHGQDTTNANVVVDYYWGGGGHADTGPLGRVSEDTIGWGAVYGKAIEHLNEPLSVVIDDSPRFAGAQGIDYGSTTSKHPSYHQDETQATAADLHWFLDMLPFDGGELFSNNPGATLVSGQLYKYTPGTRLARKQLATLAASGGSALLDVSGPGSQLTDQPSDSYKYCVANLAGECTAGSAAGDVFINAPNVKYLFCTGGDGPNPQNRDLCLGNAGAWVQGMTQIYLGATSAESIAQTRVVTHGLAGVKDMFYYSTAKALPDASWALFNVGKAVGAPTDQINVWMAKLPPLVRQDNLDRTTFARATISIVAPRGKQIESAAVEFGYAEQGAPSQFFCTSRRETCVAVGSTVKDETPFYYAQTETYTRTPCATSCTITLPVLPAHTAYYQVKFYDAKGNLAATGDRGVAIEGTLAKAGATQP